VPLQHLKTKSGQVKIRNKILIYFSSTVIALSAISLTIIYILFYEYREEEFQQQQNDKIKYTIRLLAEYKEMSEELANIMDELTIHDFYDEKMLVFDIHKNLIFSSIDDLPISGYKEILNELSPENSWIETKEDDYDIIGVYVKSNQASYYAISKAYDAFGYSKMYFLRNVLIGIFIVGTGIVIFISVFLSNKISKPITALAEQLNLFKLSGENKTEIETDISSFEVKHLADRFNELLRRTNESFEFQKHTVNHISHQLKTPIAVLVSELEKIKGYSNIDAIKCDIESQINKTKSLGSIINALLEISKIESGQEIKRAYVRIDELIFDIIDEINTIFPDFHFEVNYTPDEIEENNLLLNVNEMLIRQAFHNLLINCITYSNNSKAEIKFDCTSNNQLKIVVANTGKQVSSDEKKYLFNHFFRGKNSKGKIGFGLGLVLAKKIITISSGTITYSTPSENLNLFEVRFPLS
jgi:two-component system, OmpR family, sensor histidine kinase ArlS